MALVVQLADAWLVDVGFGAFAIEPLRLARVLAHEGAHLVQRANEGGWKNEYLVDRTSRSVGDFNAMMVYHQTSPESHFTQSELASLATSQGRITLAGMRRIVTSAGARTEDDLDAPGREATLATIFG